MFGILNLTLAQWVLHHLEHLTGSVAAALAASTVLHPEAHSEVEGGALLPRPAQEDEAKALSLRTGFWGTGLVQGDS